MGVRSDVLTVLRGGKPDRAPWTIYGIELSRGRAERELRNRRLGIVRSWPVCEASTPNVEVESRTMWENGKRSLRRTYHTPVGTVSERIEFSSSYYNEGYESEWIVEYKIKTLSDYDVVRFIIEDTVYREDHQGFVEAQRRLGEDGLLLARMGRSPLQRLLIEMAGFERVALDLNDHPDVVEGLFHVMEEKQNEVYRIGVIPSLFDGAVYCHTRPSTNSRRTGPFMASSPGIGITSSAELIWSPDNVSTSLTSPRWFERYLVPFYNRHAPMIHDAGKLYLAHMDGSLRGIKHLISLCDLAGC